MTGNLVRIAPLASAIADDAADNAPAEVSSDAAIPLAAAVILIAAELPSSGAVADAAAKSDEPGINATPEA